MSLPWSRKPGASPADAVDAADDAGNGVTALAAQGVAEPGSTLGRCRADRPPRLTDALYSVAPSFADCCLGQYLPGTKCMLLEDGQSVAAFFELAPVGTEGREMAWAMAGAMRWRTPCRTPSTSWTTAWWCSSMLRQTVGRSALPGELPAAACAEQRVQRLPALLRPSRAIAKPGGLFEDITVTRLPWARPVRRAHGGHRRVRGPGLAAWPIARAGADHDLRPPRRRAGECRREGSASRRGDIHAWLLRWFNRIRPCSAPAEDRERFYALTRYPEEREEGEIELASGTDFAQRLFFGQPRSDVPNGLWFFDGMPHRVIVMDRLRTPPVTGHLTGETRKGGDAMNVLFDQMPEDTVMCLTLVATPRTYSRRTSTTSPGRPSARPGLGADPAGRAAGARLRIGSA